MSAKLRGIFTPTLVPLDARGQINETELRRFVSWLIDRGVHGLYPNGSTGEFTRFTAEERRRIVQITCDENRGRVPVLAGAAEANVKETLDACAAYAEMGAQAVAIVAPFYFRLSRGFGLCVLRGDRAQLADRSYAVQHSDVRQPDRRTDHPPPGARISARRRDQGFLRRPGVHDAHDLRRAPHRPDFSFLTGLGGGARAHAHDRLRRRYARQQQRGPGSDAAASTNSRRAGKFEEAMKWNYRILELFDAMLYPFEFPDGFRAAAELRGFDFGNSRQPQTRCATVRPRSAGEGAAMYPGRFRTGGPAGRRVARRASSSPNRTR